MLYGRLSNIGLLIERVSMNILIKKLLSHSLARNSMIVFVGATTANIGAYLYHLIIGRILGPVGYGELSSLISLLYIFGVPTIVLQTVLIKYFSICYAKQSDGQARYLFLKITRTLLVILVPTVAFLCLFSPFISNFLHLSNSRVVIWVFLLFIFSTLSAVNGSVIQGFQMFLWLAGFSAGVAIFKLGFSIPFAYHGVEMTMIASFLIAALTYLVYLIPIRFLFKIKSEPMEITKKDLAIYSIPTFFTLLGMTALYSMDIVLAKHYLPSYEAGIYSAVAVLGKVIFYASSAIGTVLFPVLSERHAKGIDTFPIVRLSIILVSGVSLGAVLVYTFFSGTVTHLLFGSSYNQAAIYLGIFAVFIAIYSIANIIVSACLATERMNVYIFTCCAAILQISTISFFHESLIQIIYINIVIASTLLIGVGGYYVYGKDKHYHPSV